MSFTVVNVFIFTHDVRRLRAIADPAPARTFLEAAFPECVTEVLEASGFAAPTPIQSQAWPLALSGLDVIGLANTGSGKTLGFVLPAVVHIVAQPHLRPGDGPIALLLAPTRELAVQIKEQCDAFGSCAAVKNTAVYGGVEPRPAPLSSQQSVVTITVN